MFFKKSLTRWRIRSRIRCRRGSRRLRRGTDVKIRTLLLRPRGSGNRNYNKQFYFFTNADKRPSR